MIVKSNEVSVNLSAGGTFGLADDAYGKVDSLYGIENVEGTGFDDTHLNMRKNFRVIGDLR